MTLLGKARNIGRLSLYKSQSIFFNMVILELIIF
jgi:hypothetical protein